MSAAVDDPAGGIRAEPDQTVEAGGEVVPDPDFLIETVPFFTAANVAFVQTPQAYGDLTTIIARGAAYMQTVFYRFVQRGRNR